MLRPVPMVHVRIQVANREASAVTRAIAAQGLLHLVDLAHGRVGSDAAPEGTHELLAAFRDLSHRVERLANRLELSLPEPAGRLEPPSHADQAQEREEIEAVLAPLEKEVGDAWSARAAARAGLRHGEEARARAGRLSAAGVELGRVRRARFGLIRFGSAATDELASLAALLAPAPFAIVPLESAGESPLVAVAVPATQRSRLENALRVVEFAQIPLPDKEDEWSPARLEAEIAEATGQIQREDARIASCRDQRGKTIRALALRIQTAVLLLQAQTHFAAAGRFVVISGWVPAESAATLRDAVRERTEGRAVVEVDQPQDLPQVASGALKVPILHRNPILLRPFQKLVQIYGTPAYEEVEPTAFFAISFLLMFGLMFGDLGHGLVLFSAGYLLFRQVPRYLDYGILLMEGGVSAALFGLLYGSFFGVEGLLPVLWIEPLREPARFLPLAIGLGLILVSLGLVLNVVNTWRAGERGLALFGTRGLFGAFGYWVVAALLARTLTGGRGIPAWLIFLLLAIPALLLILRGPIVARLDRGKPARRRGAEAPTPLAALEGSVELVDSVVSYFANTISFLRVGAFAMVHAGAFLALFAVADAISRVRGGGVLSVLMLVAGNAVMILLEGLTVSVQVLRLEYYEFFGKFFRGGGEPYRPLMLRPAGAPKGEAP
jgi:V/A-type H+-transporting ATPase subunit I